MQHRSFRIDDILAEDTRPNDTAKPEGKEGTEVTVARRPPILLPRIEPIVWSPCMSNCRHSPSNCGRFRGEPKSHLPPWYYHRNPQGFPGKRLMIRFYSSALNRIRVCIGLLYAFSLKLFLKTTLTL